MSHYYYRRQVSSLLSISINVIASNLHIYSNDLDNSIKCLPIHAKDRIFKKIITRQKLCRGLNINEILESLVHKQMKFVDLSNFEINNTTLKILQRCEGLQKLYIKNLGNHHELTAAALKELFSVTKNLQVLDVSNMNEFDDNMLKCLTDNCPQIYELYLEGCNITDQGLIYLTGRNKSLKYLTISKTKITGEGILKAIVDNCQDLQELRIDDCAEVTNEVLKTILKHCPKIENLTFHNCFPSDETALLQDILGNCKNLKQLHWTVKW